MGTGHQPLVRWVVAISVVLLPTPPTVSAALVIDFEGEALGAEWTRSDTEATLALTADAALVAAGRGSLELLYTAREGVFQQIGATGLTVDQGTCLSLKLKATSPTSVSLGVQERNGAAYQGLLWLAPEQWTTVGSRLSDLILAENAVDDDGQLDAEEITGFFLADLANLAGEVGSALGWKDGEQRLWLDDLGVTDDAKIPSRGRVEKVGEEWLIVFDGFESEVPWVLPIRQARLKLVPGAPKAAGGQALEFTYGLAKGRWVGLVSAPPGWLDKAAATKFHLWIKAALNVRTVVVLEERDGSKYETALKPPPDDKWHEAVLPLSEFLINAATPDENGQLDPGQVHRVVVLVDTFDADMKPNGTAAVALDDLGMIAPTAPAVVTAP